MRRPHRTPRSTQSRRSRLPQTEDPQRVRLRGEPTINAATINTLAGCGWVTKGQSLCLIGDSGTGKSHLLIGLGITAAHAGHKVRYVLAAKLVNGLVEAADERQLSRTITRYGRLDLLCIDELGYLELDKHGAEVLFQVLTERWPWGLTLGNEGLERGLSVAVRAGGTARS